MTTSVDEKANLRAIIQALLDDDREWLNKQEILWGDKEPYWILNYRPGGRNEYNRLVRGLVVRKGPFIAGSDPLDLIVSFPFIRFFNQCESEADVVDLDNAHMLEKMDGTMVGTFFPTKNEDEPHWHTRKMLCTHTPDMEMTIEGFHGGDGYRFMPLIGEYVRELNFTSIDVPYTYVFEFIHDASLVLTKYGREQYGLYLIGGRNVYTHDEISEEELDHIAARINSKRPRRWDAVASEEEIRGMMREMVKELPDFEGYVFRDKLTGKRIKIKDAEYLKKHRLIGNLSIKNLIPCYLENETEEILAYFPHAKDKIDLISNRLDEYLTQAVDVIVDYINRAKAENWNQKQLALHVFGPKDQGGVANKFVQSHLMRTFIQEEELDVAQVRENILKSLRELALGKGNNAGSPKRLAEMLGFGEEEAEEAEAYDTEL